MKPKISVIIPVYNDEEYIGRCLNSLINQSLKEIEIICINDGSNDNSLEILEEYKNKDDRIQIISQKNQGAGISRNNGIKLAEGEYISFVDADDWMELDSLEKLYKNANANDSEMVLFNSIEHGINELTRERIYLPADESVDYDNFVFDYNYEKKLVMNKMFVIWSKIYKTSFLKENNLEFYSHKIFNDVQFHIESMLLAKRISYLPEILYHYNRANENSLQTKATSSNNKIIIFDVFRGVKDFLINHNYYDEFKQNFAQFMIVESRANLLKTSDEFKDDYYYTLRSEFIKMNFDSETLNKFPFGLYNFYMLVLNCETYSNFDLFKTKISKDDIEIDEISEITLNDDESIGGQTGQQEVLLSQDKLFLFNLEHQLYRKNKHIKNLNNKINILEQKNEKLNNKLTSFENNNIKLKEKNKKLKTKNQDIINQNKELKKLIKEYESSTSWKITKPLRKTTNMFKK
ncbi:glycosyltransferase [uncultured Methanobrevibacter sp.]|uniref:glycosyltransferase family 2 protein n=1 Tax=uncultured Methanobrevibacter sp. TaxID=253161 RepID=UPI0025F0ECF5|nr:glycosyltransferase [uncultured Methanobrevibacter sp.]